MNLIEDLNTFPRDALLEVRNISNNASHIEVTNLLKTLVSSDNYRYVNGFYKDVIKGGVNPELWRQRNCFVLDMGLNEMLVMPVDKWPYLNNQELEIIHIKPSLFSWHGNGFIAGSLAIFDKKINYKVKAYKKTIKSFVKSDEYCRDFNLGIAARRYMASRIALFLHVKKIPIIETSKDETIDLLGVSNETLCNDAKCSLSALFKESDKFEIGVDGVPGFLGDDSWYAM